MLPSPPETRASLILRLPNAADVAAWDEAVDVFGPLVFRLAISRGMQSADADDLVQEVFSAAAKQVGAWLDRPQRGRFRAWLLRMARNIAVNMLTRRPLGAAGIGGDDAMSSLAEAPAASDLSNQFDAEYQTEVIRWAAEHVRHQFSSKTWQAFELTHIQGMSIPDASAELAMTVGSIYIARSRVVHRLREVARQFEVQD